MILMTFDSIFGGLIRGGTFAELAVGCLVVVGNCCEAETLVYCKCTPEEVGLPFRSIKPPLASPVLESEARPSRPPFPPAP
jgi:hypothetical protein